MYALDSQTEKRYRRERLFEPLPSGPVIPRAQIEDMIPHRGPMLLLDEITALDAASGRIEGRRTLREDDPGFNGHFPEYPVYPGVLQIEMAGQLGLCLGVKALQDQAPEHSELSIRLWKVHKSVFVAELRPHDEITVLAEILEDTGATIICAGQLVKGNTIVSFSIVEAIIDT